MSGTSPGLGALVKDGRRRRQNQDPVIVMSAAPEFYLFLTCLGVGALLLVPLAWSAGEEDPFPRSRILRRERGVGNRANRIWVAARLLRAHCSSRHSHPTNRRSLVRNLPFNVLVVRRAGRSAFTRLCPMPIRGMNRRTSHETYRSSHSL